MTPAAVKRLEMTEKAWSQQVTDLAKLFGWVVYHPYLSIRSTPGFPDLTLIRPPRLVFAELKTDRGKTSEHQDRWLGLLGAVPGVEVYLWRPSQFDEVQRVLRRAA